MKPDVLLAAHFCSDFDGKGNNRFNYLANLLSENKFNVELVTSDFSHSKKEKRTQKNFGKYNYKITYINEPIYYKNVSLRRFFSHYKMARNLQKYLKDRKKPDLIYCAVPSLSVAKVLAKYANENSVKFIIDIQDIWPEAFKLIFNYPVISDISFFPMKKRSEYIYRSADEIIAVSKTYGELALKYNKKCKKSYDIFLGTELRTFDELQTSNQNPKKIKDEVWLGYAGTLGHSYDLTAVINALAILKKQGITDIKIIVMGDGPLKEKFEEHASQEGIKAKFTGRLAYAKMVSLLKTCDIAVNPISKGAAQSIINKHGDYAAAGLPVVNTQESPEYRNIVEDYNIGFNCENNNPKDLAEKICELYKDESLRNIMGTNHRKLAEEKFDRSHTYVKIVELIKNNLV